jgi:hypothetical protein
MAVAGVVVRRASGLRPSYYPFEYPMMYTSEEEEKGRVRRGKRKGKGGGESMRVWREAAMDSLKFH